MSTPSDILSRLKNLAVLSHYSAGVRPAIPVVIDVDRKYLSPAVLQYIGVLSVLLHLPPIVPLELDDQYRRICILKRKIDNIGTAVTRRKLIELQVFIAVRATDRSDDVFEQLLALTKALSTLLRCWLYGTPQASHRSEYGRFLSRHHRKGTRGAQEESEHRPCF